MNASFGTNSGSDKPRASRSGYQRITRQRFRASVARDFLVRGPMIVVRYSSMDGGGRHAMNLVELFCGTGGFSRGAHAAGFNVAAAYDLDPILTSSYQKNFPKTKLRHRNVAVLTGDEIAKDVEGEVFGVFGGPPCQGFSDIGKRDMSDPRRLLLRHFFAS